MELTTERANDGAMTTKTPGAPAGGFGDPSALFQALIKNRLQQGNTVSAAPVAPPRPMSVRGARPQASEGMMRQTYTPQMGSQQKKEEITRVVADPRHSRNINTFWPGNPVPYRHPTVRERYIDGVGWEFGDRPIDPFGDPGKR